MGKLLSKQIIKEEPVYDLSVKGNHNFFANSILVHNCLATGKSSTQGSNILKLKADFQVAASGTILLNNPGNC